MTLSNSTPTCKPISTSVGWRRSWLCFPTGRKREGRKNPHLASRSWNGPRCLNFGDCLAGVWKVFGSCLEGVWQVSVDCLEGVLWVSGMCREGVLSVSGGYLGDVWMVCGVLRCIWRASQVKSGQVNTGQSRLVKSGNVKSSQDRLSQVRIDQVRSRQVKSIWIESN